jgi:hypothetical protein
MTDDRPAILAQPKPSPQGRKPRKPLRRTSLKRSAAPSRRSGIQRVQASGLSTLRGRIPRVSKAAYRKAWRKAVDLARKLARLRDGRCLAAGEYINCGGVLNGCHIFGVGAYPGVALDEQNILSACGGHHRWFDHHPIEWESFARTWIGDKAYDELRARAVVTQKPDAVEFLAEHCDGL